MNDESAFPVCEEVPHSTMTRQWWGLSKREYFAAMALQGMCANTDLCGLHDMYGEDAVKYADALMIALASPDTTGEKP
jgi:hypothetical protein